MGRLWSQLALQRSASELAGVAVDAVRSRRELIIENAVLRHQVNVLRRRRTRPKLNLVDRLKLLIGARLLRRGIARSPSSSRRPSCAGIVPASACSGGGSCPRKTSPVPPETIDLIRDMAARGRLWGAERIRGELLKLGIKVSKRTIQKYMRSVRGRSGSRGQRWATFLKNHAERMWVCDFI
jgi:isopropylmalate/homocitrate/citramalate synthase